MFILLTCIADGFKELKHQGTELKRKFLSNPSRDHYRDILMQNEWISCNLFDAMGNYLLCHTCIIKALNVSPQRLSRQWKYGTADFISVRIHS